MLACRTTGVVSFFWLLPRAASGPLHVVATVVRRDRPSLLYDHDFEPRFLFSSIYTASSILETILQQQFRSCLFFLRVDIASQVEYRFFIADLVTVFHTDLFCYQYFYVDTCIVVSNV